MGKAEAAAPGRLCDPAAQAPAVHVEDLVTDLLAAFVANDVLPQ